jgi:hypothetical protein
MVVDSEGIEPSSPGCRPGILPLNDEPMLAGRTGFEPVDLFADNEAATLAASRPSSMGRTDKLEDGPGGRIRTYIFSINSRASYPLDDIGNGSPTSIRTRACGLRVRCASGYAMGLWSRRLDSNQRLPASDAGENNQASLRLVCEWVTDGRLAGTRTPICTV